MLHGLFIWGLLWANSPGLVWTLGVQSKQNEKCSLTHWLCIIISWSMEPIAIYLCWPKSKLFFAPLRASASLTSLSRRQITALTLSLPMWKGCAGATHRKQDSVSPQLPLTQYLKYRIGQLPQIPALCQELVKEVIRAQQIQLQWIVTGLHQDDPFGKKPWWFAVCFYSHWNFSWPG